MYSNFIISLICRAIQILCAFFSIRYLVGILGTENYGIWITLSSVLSWMMTLDFGLANGVRNRISESWAKGTLPELTNVINSTTLFYFFLSVTLGLIFFVATKFIEPYASYPTYSTILIVTASVLFFCAFGSIVLQSVGEFKIFCFANLILPISWLAYIYLHRQQTLTIGIVVETFSLLISLQYLVIYAVSYSWLRKRQVKISLFKFSHFRFNHIKQFIILGSSFFVLQISYLLLSLSGNFIVYHYSGPRDVILYDTMTKVFLLFNVVYSLATTIAWTEISKAKVVHDVNLKKRVFNLLILGSLLIVLCSVLFSVNIEWIVNIITGAKVTAEPYQAFAFVFLLLIQMLSLNGSTFLNAYEVIKPQVKLTFIVIPLFLLLISLFIHLDFGFIAVPLANGLAMLPVMLFNLVVGYHYVKLK